MAYNLYDLGIPGKEIKRRLNMLGGIENDVNDAIAVAITKLDDKIQIDIINALNVKGQISYIDAGTVTDLVLE